jgi:hypothetical protein
MISAAARPEPEPLPQSGLPVLNLSEVSGRLSHRQ